MSTHDILTDGEQIREYLVALAIQAGADPKRARERMAQAAQVWLLDRCEREEQLRKWRAVAEMSGDMAEVTRG